MKWGILTLSFFAPVLTLAAVFNAGFVQGLWYSEETFFANDTVRIYVAIRNNTGSDLTGTVEFFDNDKRIGRSTVSALDGRIIESWVDWEPEYGEHTISASISKIELHTVGAQTETITVRESLAEDVIFIDHDTDNDGVGNQVDIDDDGDGISDSVEQKNGTDPLVYTHTATETTPDADAVAETGETSKKQGTTTREGFEQYLTPSRADHMFEAITNYTQSLKQDLDQYRQVRDAARSDEAQETAAEIAVNEGGFGEITRTDKGNTTTEEEKEPQKKTEEPRGFVGDLVSFVGAIFSGIYTGILTVLSWLLGHPMLVQLMCLFGILFALYKLAKRFGSRPQ